MGNLDTKRLFQIFNANPTSKALGRFLASRERASRNTNLAQCRYIFKNGFKKKGEKKYTFSPFPDFDREDFDKTWQDLESLGVGQISVTPGEGRGKAALFEWAGYEPSSIGAAGLDPKKQPVLAEFRERAIAKKKFHSRVVKSAKKQAPISLPKKEGRQKANLTKKYDDMQEATISGTRVFANFMTQNFENIRLEFKNGLSQTDKERLIEMIEGLPVNQ